MSGGDTLTLRHDGLTFSAFERLPEQASPRGTVLVMHGFPDDHRSFEGLADRLAAAGYRVVVPVMRGYEPSSQRRNAYHVSLLADDVVGWMDALGEEHAHVVGHDWGAAVGYSVANLAPQRVRSLTTLAVPHARRLGRAMTRLPKQLLNSWYMGFFQLPLLPERALRRGFIDRLWRDWSPGWEPSLDALARVHARFALPGVIEAALGYYRAMLRASGAEWRRTRELMLGRVKVPTLALTGADDACMDSALYDTAMVADDFPAGLAVERVADAGHWLHLEQPRAVNETIATWLLRSDN